jgi:hypothetical protein
VAHEDDAVFFDGVQFGRHAGDAGRVFAGRTETQTEETTLIPKDQQTSFERSMKGGTFTNVPGLPGSAVVYTIPPPSNLNPRTPWTKEDYLREFTKLTEKMRAITERKNNDYATDADPFRNFRTFAELGILVRMSDKFSRLRTAIEDKREFKVDDETIEDTCLDLANYALLLLCYRRGA